MILGIRHQTEEDIEEPFQQTGTLHLFAVAGLHVGIMARLLWIVATVIRLPRSIGTLLIVPGLLFYAAVTGPSYRERPGCSDERRVADRLSRRAKGIRT
jgi:competence protein ComEC